MHIFDNVFFITLVIFISLYFVIVRIQCDNIYDQDDENSDREDELPSDNYLFVALIDIVFTDGSKRTCTGTIIHDNVVITAGHCFSNEDTQPELTASFVVIGTKKMFDTGYEQYLPIERVIIHPNHRGWTADLALVHTFAGMMSDKPGRIVRLASEKTSTDSDVTVFSWGRYKDEESTTIAISTTPPSEADSCSDDKKVDSDKDRTKRKKKRRSTIKSIESDFESVIPSTIGEQQSDDANRFTKRQRRRKRKRRIRLRTGQESYVQVDIPRVLRMSTKPHENVSSFEKNIQYRHREQISKKKLKYDSRDQNNLERKKENSEKMFGQSVISDKRKRRKANKMTYYKNNWRRKMGNQKNKLTIDVFGFVNTQACEKLVVKAMPALYNIKNQNEMLCYSSEDHYITEEDAGAPAMRLGRLVAVTVGGVDFDGERVAVGMKIICFCSWIAENLPKSGAKIQCCKNCCEIKEEKETRKDTEYKHSHKKKKIRKI